MKRLVTICSLLLISISTLCAQQGTKRVAILEVVDKEGKVTYAVKLQLRSSLIYAISHTEGYEALERVDLPSIMDEHKFQRSGHVSDAEIKEIGRMNSADYVLVAEVASYPGNKIIVTAKLLDVVTARVSASADPQYASIEIPDEMREACIQTARTLLGKKKKNVPRGYTDLGLPSGKLWNDFNAQGFYTYDEAVSQFGNRLPTKADWEELKAECQWSWTGSGYKVTGPNGNSITLPAAGFRYDGGVGGVGSYGCYWSSTPNGSDRAWALYFSSGSVVMSNDRRYIGQSVRLVQD